MECAKAEFCDALDREPGTPHPVASQVRALARAVPPRGLGLLLGGYSKYS